MRNKHTGTTFDSFLQEEGIRQEVETVAIKRVLAWQFKKAMSDQHKTKVHMAKELHTSRSQLERLLDPNKLSVTLSTISKAAKVLGKEVVIQLSDVKEPVRTENAKYKSIAAAASVGGEGFALWCGEVTRYGHFASSATSASDDYDARRAEENNPLELTFSA